MFEYDHNSPLNLKEISSQQRGDVTVKDIAYTSPLDAQKSIGAYLIVPPGEGDFPAVLWVHWYDPHFPNSNRTQFLDEAVMMAEKHGVLSLLPETMWSEVTWYREGRTLDTDYEDAIRQTIELRRAMDVLLAQPNIDLERVLYVGHDFGAMYGSLLAGVDRRAKAYVLIAGASNFNKWMLFGVEPTTAGLDAYKAKMEALAPTHFVAQAAPAPIFFQFGTNDFYTPLDDIDRFYEAASDPKEIKRYESEHAMDLPQIREDRYTFLKRQLGL